MTPPLRIQGLHVSYGEGPDVVRGLDLTLEAGESYGLVGESGCGKSTVALAVQGHLDEGGVSAGSIVVDGHEITRMDEPALRRLRGRTMSMVYQDPIASLNPTTRIGRQLSEAARNNADGQEGIFRVLERVRLPEPERLLRRWPHELSGGQAQRVVIAMALLARPKLLVLDEPTTGLDVTVEAEVTDLVAEIAAEGQAAILYISHDLGLIAKVATRVGVMYSGRLVEEGDVRDVLGLPAHPYTRALLDCLPAQSNASRRARLSPIPGQVPSPDALPVGCVFAPRCPHVVPPVCSVSPEPEMIAAGVAGHLARCRRLEAIPARSSRPVDGDARRRASKEPLLEVSDLVRAFGGGLLNRAPKMRAADGVSFGVGEGETVAMVGESGSGKSTIARILVGLDTADSGTAMLGAHDISRLPSERRPQKLIRRIQLVFQNPDGTLNPAHRVGRILSRALKRAGRNHGRRDVADLLALVRLPAEAAERRPGALSGGQRQRVAIARAFAGAPDLVLADEPTSALDVSVQAAIIELLDEVQRAHGTAILFISHDLALVRHVADRVVVLYRGQVMEEGPAERVFRGPSHPYTEALLAAMHPPDPDYRSPELDAPDDGAPPPPEGCPFQPRCHRRIPVCVTDAPPLRLEDGHAILCHHGHATLDPGSETKGDASCDSHI